MIEISDDKTCLIHNLAKDQTIIVLTNASDYSAIDMERL